MAGNKLVIFFGGAGYSNERVLSVQKINGKTVVATDENVAGPNCILTVPAYTWSITIQLSRQIKGPVSIHNTQHTVQC